MKTIRSLTFTPAQIDKLRMEYAKFETMPVSALDRFRAIFDKMADVSLIDLAKANVKFVSSLALNACSRRNLAVNLS